MLVVKVSNETVEGSQEGMRSVQNDLRAVQAVICRAVLVSD